MKEENIILTGLPRSGTTLSVQLLNKLPNTISLNEPISFSEIRDVEDKTSRVDFINDFFLRERKTILESGTAVTRHIGGEIPDNNLSNTRNEYGLRQTIFNEGRIKINKKLTDGFNLVIKHPAAFTAMLDSLIFQFPCYAIIRNPLAVLGSWDSADLPIHNGRASAAEKLDQTLKFNLDKIEERVDRQLYLLSWLCEKYLNILPRQYIIRYEEIIETGGKALAVIVSDAENLDETLVNKNNNNLYDPEIMQIYAKMLLNKNGSYLKFYSKDEVVELAESYGIVC